MKEISEGNSIYYRNLVGHTQKYLQKNIYIYIGLECVYLHVSILLMVVYTYLVGYVMADISQTAKYDDY